MTDQRFRAAAADIGIIPQMRRLSVVPQIANHGLAVFSVLACLQGIDIPEQFPVCLPFSVSQGGTNCTHPLRSAVVMPLFLQVFLQMKAVQHMLSIRKLLAKRHDPARPVSVNV